MQANGNAQLLQGDNNIQTAAQTEAVKQDWAGIKQVVASIREYEV